MPICKRNVEVECPIDVAFEHVADWKNFKSFIPFFLNLKPVSVVEYGPGTSLETTISIGRIEVGTAFDLVEFLKNKKILYKASRGLKSKISWEFKQLTGKVLVTFIFEYEIPPGLVTRNYEREAFEKELQSAANSSMDLLVWVLQSVSGQKND
jgi:ribosome-associated toxin RatA of RatAB toxin-antitoxin module